MFTNQNLAKFMKLIHAKKLNADPLQNRKTIQFWIKS